MDDDEVRVSMVAGDYFAKSVGFRNPDLNLAGMKQIANAGGLLDEYFVLRQPSPVMTIV